VVGHFSDTAGTDGSLVMHDENAKTFDMHPKGLAQLLSLQKSTIRISQPGVTPT
jgi:hypothetical protein